MESNIQVMNDGLTNKEIVAIISHLEALSLK